MDVTSRWTSSPRCAEDECDARCAAFCKAHSQLHAQVKSCQCRAEAANGNFCLRWQCIKFNDDGRGAIGFVDYNCTASYNNATIAPLDPNAAPTSEAVIRGLAALPPSFYAAVGATRSLVSEIALGQMVSIEFYSLLFQVTEFDPTNPNHTFCSGWYGRCGFSLPSEIVENCPS